MTTRKGKTRKPIPNLEAPNAGELDVLAVLWDEAANDRQPLKLSEIHRRVCERRQQHSDPEPAISTISGHLRRLLDKHLVREVAAAPRGAGPAPPSRGMLTPPTRSPLTSYEALHEHGDVLFTTYRGLLAACPPQQRLRALLDFAAVLDLPDEFLTKLEKLVTHHERDTRTDAGTHIDLRKFKLDLGKPGDPGA